MTQEMMQYIIGKDEDDIIFIDHFTYYVYNTVIYIIAIQQNMYQVRVSLDINT